MGIVPPSSGNAWRNPHQGRPSVTVRQTSQGDHLVTVRPGADVAELADALDRIPADSVFTEHLGTVNAVLVFRAVPGNPTVAEPGTPTGWTPDPLAGHAVSEPDDHVPVDLRRPDYETEIRHSLKGVRLGEYDEIVVQWLGGLPTPKVLGVATLISRARLAELRTFP